MLSESASAKSRATCMLPSFSDFAAVDQMYVKLFNYTLVIPIVAAATIYLTYLRDKIAAKLAKPSTEVRGCVAKLLVSYCDLERAGAHAVLPVVILSQPTFTRGSYNYCILVHVLQYISGTCTLSGP